MLKTICLLLLPALLHAQHPITFFTTSEASAIKKDIGSYPLLAQSFNDIKKEVDEWVDKDVDVPFPKDPAGGYTHDRHKANYILMFNSGLLYNLTGNAKYARLVKNMLFKYAALNPTLKKHPQATSNSPGHIFWQALNDANWLVYTGMAYDLIKTSLNTAEIKTIEDGAFKPEVDFLTKDLQKWFDLIHNHGVWACAGVGITGIAMDNKEYVEMALYGTARNGKSGFIAQLDHLFSPDGYYTEGPYYVRYAILPYYLFANALHRARPDIKIFEHRNRILQKALHAALQQTNIDGRFLPFNDAVKEKDFTTNELVAALNIAWDVYGKNDGLLPVARKQGRVMLHKGGASVARALATSKNIPLYYPYRSIEFTDGVKGDEGGVSLLRTGSGAALTTLFFKYSAHGLSHGHYDKLTFGMFDKGNEIFTDYGSARWVNVEQKYGGRYLPENHTYAAQTIAHNTIVVDETSHFNGQEKKSEQHHSQKFFSSISNPKVQAVSAKENNAYEGVQLHRSLYLLELPEGKRIVADIFSARSAAEHLYDLPFQYNGHLISTSVLYKANTKTQETLGIKSGYQFLWKEAEGFVKDTLAQLTFLKGRTYYTITSLIRDSASIVFARSGANDPNFNLRHEPSWIIRKKGKDPVFVNILEIHGDYNPITEFSSNAYPSVKKIQLLMHDEMYSVAEVTIGDNKLIIAQANSNADPQKKHTISNEKLQLVWTGPFTVMYNGKYLLNENN
ncbi:MAG TPA: alginate lyase family protein [Chitinophagaceae bacterium]